MPNEVEFWFSSTMRHKTSKEIESMDWESCQSKYQDIHEKFVEHYPTPVWEKNIHIQELKWRKRF